MAGVLVTVGEAVGEAVGEDVGADVGEDVGEDVTVGLTCESHHIGRREKKNLSSHQLEETTANTGIIKDI